MNQGGLARLIRAAFRRFAHLTQVMVLIAPTICGGSAPISPQGLRLIRVSRTSTGEECALARKAMQDAGELSGLVAARLAHGDEFIGWQLQQGDVVCFGWVTHSDRHIGPTRLPDAPHRAFLFNFHTLAPYRRQGLYLSLLQSIRHVLAMDSVAELVIDVNVKNRASSRAIVRAGFSVATEVCYCTIFTRWHYLLVRPVFSTSNS